MCHHLRNKKIHKIAFFNVTRGIIYIHARVMVLMHDMSSECALQMYEVSLTSDGYQVIEQTRNSIANILREITQTYPKQSYGSCA